MWKGGSGDNVERREIFKYKNLKKAGEIELVVLSPVFANLTYWESLQAWCILFAKMHFSVYTLLEVLTDLSTIAWLHSTLFSFHPQYNLHLSIIHPTLSSFHPSLYSTQPPCKHSVTSIYHKYILYSLFSSSSLLYSSSTLFTLNASFMQPLLINNCSPLSILHSFIVQPPLFINSSSILLN